MRRKKTNEAVVSPNQKNDSCLSWRLPSMSTAYTLAAAYDLICCTPNSALVRIMHGTFRKVLRQNMIDHNHGFCQTTIIVNFHSRSSSVSRLIKLFAAFAFTLLCCDLTEAARRCIQIVSKVSCSLKNS
jgi:hypothetical protein